MYLLDVAPLSPQEMFWISVERYLPFIALGVLALAGIAAFLIIKATKKK